MILKEFFSKPLNINSLQKNNEKDNAVKSDELFWFMIDHDKLHKDYFFPIAKKIKTLKECGPDMVLELFMPMVKKGCKEYYADKKLQGKLSKLFPKDLREELCHRLYDHYAEDVKTEKYNLGN